MRDQIEATLYRSDEPEVHLRAEITLVSMSPADVDWFCENCPGWQDHVSARQFKADTYVSRFELGQSQVPNAVLRYVHRDLWEHLARDIVSRMEPMVTAVE